MGDYIFRSWMIQDDDNKWHDSDITKGETMKLREKTILDYIKKGMIAERG